jgi:diguanylate cyclase (GGDEF)-like protein
MFMKEQAVILIGKWLCQRIDLGDLETRGGILSFALAVSFRSVILTTVVGLGSLPVLYGLGILDQPIALMVKLTIVFSWLFAGVISGVLAFMAGHVIRDLTRSRAEFEHLSRTDSLSGLANRRAFHDAFTRIDGEASLAIIDIDRFKLINDRFGHQAGDRVIQAIAAVLQRVFGEAHILARLGGEEFGVILTGGSWEQRLVQMEMARRCVAAEAIAFDDVELSVTISVGVAEFLRGVRAESIYAAADKALYLAKDNGRDRVIHERTLYQSVHDQPMHDVSCAVAEDAPHFGVSVRRC